MKTLVHLACWSLLFSFGLNTVAFAYPTPLTPNPLGRELAPTDKATFCKRVDDPQIVAKLANEPTNLTGFDGQGGIFNLSGDCWWHSRLQRSALYLTVFRPDLPPPTNDEEVHEIFKNIQRNRKVVEIPGYKNWQQFSAAWMHQLQNYLNLWVWSDSLIRQAWVNGLMNRANPTDEKASDRLRKLIQEIEEEVVEQKQVAFVKLPMDFPVAHAWLIYNMVKTDTGYDLWVIDSNYSTPPKPHQIIPQQFVYHYKDGDEFFDLGNTDVFNADGPMDVYYDHFNPFPQHESDYKKFQKAISDYCR